MTRPYASHIDFHFYQGSSCKADCLELLYEMNRVGLMSHIACLEHIGLHRKSLSMRISFSKDKEMKVPNDSRLLPDFFTLSLRCHKPVISGSVSRFTCMSEIESLAIDCGSKVLYAHVNDSIQYGRIEVGFSSMLITASGSLIADYSDST